MMRPMRNMWRLAAVVAAAALAATTACAPISNKTATGTPDKCTKDVLGTLYPGIFTFGTDQPVYPPWYMGDNPASGEGFEAAIAYAVAAKMNYAPDDVRWVRVPFNAALAPGPKTFDANLSEFSITEPRKAAVDFSSPYFDVTQAVVTVRTSPAAGVKTLQQLKRLRLGAQVGTTSYTAATSVDGDVPVEVYNTNGDAKMALSNGEIDALVADLPTAFAVANELRNGLMVGQLPSASGDVEQFGIVLDKGSPLTRCVSWAVDTLRGDGTLGGWSNSGSPMQARRPCWLSWPAPAPALSTPAWRGARCPGRRQAADRRPDPARWARRARSSSARNRRGRWGRPKSTIVPGAASSTSMRQEVPPRRIPRPAMSPALADEPRQPGRQMRYQPAVGVDPLLHIGQVAALDDAVEPLGPADQHP